MVEYLKIKREFGFNFIGSSTDKINSHNPCRKYKTSTVFLTAFKKTYFTLYSMNKLSSRYFI